MMIPSSCLNSGLHLSGTACCVWNKSCVPDAAVSESPFGSWFQQKSWLKFPPAEIGESEPESGSVISSTKIGKEKVEMTPAIKGPSATKAREVRPEMRSETGWLEATATIPGKSLTSPSRQTQ
jgi:hypothetical protein